MNYKRVSEPLVSNHPLLFYPAVAYDHFFRISEVVAYESFDCILSATTKIKSAFHFQIFANTTRANHKNEGPFIKRPNTNQSTCWVSRARKKNLFALLARRLNEFFNSSTFLKCPSAVLAETSATYISMHCNVSSLV